MKEEHKQLRTESVAIAYLTAYYERLYNSGIHSLDTVEVLNQIEIARTDYDPSKRLDPKGLQLYKQILRTL